MVETDKLFVNLLPLRNPGLTSIFVSIVAIIFSDSQDFPEE